MLEFFCGTAVGVILSAGIYNIGRKISKKKETEKFKNDFTDFLNY